MSHERELVAVHRWLDEADRIAMEYFRVGVPAEIKPDGTPVTIADRRIEEALRRSIAADFPADAILGEEEGATGSGGRRWIVDPIDGTKNYRRGIPIFATLVALEQEGQLVVGAASAPAIDTRWWAQRGGGAFRNGEAIRASRISELAHAEVASGSLDSIRAAGLLDGFLALVARAQRHRAWGDFWGHVLVAQGSIEVMIEPVVSPWDLAAPKLIVEEAGGRMTSLRGEDRIDGGDCLTSNGLLHEQALALLLAR